MKIAYLMALVALVTGFGIGGSPALAQSTRTWVSGVGDDANPCTRTAPCKTFAGAISRTAAGGEINCIDAGGFGVLTITKAISISCSAGEAGVLASGTDGIIINAGPGDAIVVDGLDIEGVSTGLDGISIMSASEVIIKNCNIHRFSGNGVTISNSTASRVIIRNSTIGDNVGSGLVVNSAPGFGRARIVDSMVVANLSDGVQVNGTGNQVILDNDEILSNNRQLNFSIGVSGGTIYSLGNSFITISSGDNPVPMALR